MAARVPLRAKDSSTPTSHLSPPEKLYFCGAGCCANGPSAFRTKETLQLHEIARTNAKTNMRSGGRNNVEVGTTSKAEYERVWNNLMAKQKEDEKKLERLYVEKWLRNIE
jgi:hypothetical protein